MSAANALLARIDQAPADHLVRGHGLAAVGPVAVPRVGVLAHGRAAGRARLPAVGDHVVGPAQAAGRAEPSVVGHAGTARRRVGARHGNMITDNSRQCDSLTQRSPLNELNLSRNFFL